MRPLTDVELTAVVGIASALIGASVAITAAWLTNRANAKVAAAARAHELTLRAQDLSRSRGEELYTLLQQWLNRLYGYYLVKQSVMSGKITYNDALDIELKERDRTDGAHVRIEMLIDVYFPGLRPQYGKVTQVRDEANDIVYKHKAEYSSGRTDGSAYMKPFHLKLQELSSTAQGLTEALLQKLRDA
jgi:hypothetical protein